ncbi:hypothetical protein DOTSEDRAFT_45323 [Dothistroma septosporum NZE10]|uniref:Uncharacterized protein n=1 Tax=Dothistroma septosporum (strain NZE10 / CBS 128990) TaxID=675120 RepID=M2Y551_DOTSN|nr:hypothetical protein DOTSEDRAFT_45323 [Dothistroma septosporum NZE10]
MNTIRSTAYGWGVLIVAGAGSYYFAKRSINADRDERAHKAELARQHRERLRAQEAVSREAASQLSSPVAGNSAAPGGSIDPSKEAGQETAPTAHAEPPRSRYEAKEPFRSRKGDRFS